MSSPNSKPLPRMLLLSLLAAAALPPIQAQPPQQFQPQAPPTGNGSVSGTVTNSVTGAPVLHAHVIVMVMGNRGMRSFNADTNAQGGFTVEKLPPGRLAFTVDRAGFVASSQLLANADLRPDEKREGLKLTLAPTGGISGRVLNAEGAGVQGAIVSLDGATVGTDPATTDEKGQFRISGIPPGKYRLSANPNAMPFPPEIRTDGTHETHDARTYYPDALTVSAGLRVEVAAGTEVSGIDIRLVRTPVVTLSGRVVDIPAGSKASVRAVSSVATGGTVKTANIVKADGSFQIWQLDPGKYTVVATTQNQGSVRGLQSAPVDIEVQGQDIGNVELRMVQPFDVSARLGFDDAKARERPTMQVRQGPQQMAPAQNAPPQPQPRRIALLPQGQTFVGMNMQQADVGDDESFTAEKLQPGRYRVAPSWGVYVKSVSIGGMETEGDILDLRNGPVGDVTVTLGALTGEVSGVVTDSSGPAAGVNVVIFGEGTFGRPPMGATSAADGTYKFAAIPPGKYRLLAGDNDILTQATRGRDTDEYADTVETINVLPDAKITKTLVKRTSGAR